MVHRVQCTLSIHKCTALNCIPVWHLHTTDMVIRVTVSSHRFHYWSPISIFLPHCAIIPAYIILSVPLHIKIRDSKSKPDICEFTTDCDGYQMRNACPATYLSHVVNAWWRLNL